MKLRSAIVTVAVASLALSLVAAKPSTPGTTPASLPTADSVVEADFEVDVALEGVPVEFSGTVTFTAGATGAPFGIVDIDLPSGVEVTSAVASDGDATFGAGHISVSGLMLAEGEILTIEVEGLSFIADEGEYKVSAQYKSYEQPARRPKHQTTMWQVFDHDGFTVVGVEAPELLDE
jgi:hypothetical protein